MIEEIYIKYRFEFDKGEYYYMTLKQEEVDDFLKQLLEKSKKIAA